MPPDNSDYVIRGKTRARGFSQVGAPSFYPPAQKIRQPPAILTAKGRARHKALVCSPDGVQFDKNKSRSALTGWPAFLFFGTF